MEKETELAKRVVNHMLENDAFSKWLGIETIEILPGKVKLKMIVNQTMLNGFYISHGGIAYSLADSALAFAANSHGIQSVSVETSISHTKAVKAGDSLFAEAIEMNVSKSLGLYYVTVTNEKNEKIAFFKGTVYRTGKPWFND